MSRSSLPCTEEPGFTMRSTSEYLPPCSFKSVIMSPIDISSATSRAIRSAWFTAASMPIKGVNSHAFFGLFTRPITLRTPYSRRASVPMTRLFSATTSAWRTPAASSTFGSAPLPCRIVSCGRDLFKTSIRLSFASIIVMLWPRSIKSDAR